MTNLPHLDPTRRHDFVYLFEVTDGNPNGDPDAGNLPRVDPETMHGLVTDVAIKRKVRDFVDVAKGEESRYKIYVQSGVALNAQHRLAYEGEGLTSTGAKQKREDIDTARAWMCENFYDIRMFGAVMTTNINAGQVRGPLQLTFARSIDPIVPLDVSITRIAVTREEDAEVVTSDDGGATGKQTEMGRKSIVPYALYRGYGFYNPHFAKKAATTGEDLDLFWQALQKMWDMDRSAARGMLALRGLYIFTHESGLGNAPAQDLFERISIKARPEVETPRKYRDYEVDVPVEGLPEGILLTRLVG